jgi:hypothetical protein
LVAMACAAAHIHVGCLSAAGAAAAAAVTFPCAALRASLSFVASTTQKASWSSGEQQAQQRRG